MLLGLLFEEPYLLLAHELVSPLPRLFLQLHMVQCNVYVLDGDLSLLCGLIKHIARILHLVSTHIKVFQLQEVQFAG